MSALAALGLAVIATGASAQVAPVANPPTTAGDKVIELSPFEVRAEDDSGYQAVNTTSGSRLATSLKDTAASISPFTYNGLNVSSRQVTAGELRAVKDVDSTMLAAQSAWLNGLLTTTLGYRRDDIVYLDTTSGRLTDPADPRVTSGQMLLNEVVLLPGYGKNTNSMAGPSRRSRASAPFRTRRLSPPGTSSTASG